MAAAGTGTARAVLLETAPAGAVRDVTAVLGGVLLTALCAQIAVPLEPFSPVPITGQTFAVLLTGAALGPARGAITQSLYLAIGMMGLPVFASGSSGTDVVFGASGGYIVGFVIAAWAVGMLARRGLDRRPLLMAASFAVGSAIIYAIGLPWLAVTVDLSVPETLSQGLYPFLVGDVVKAALAGIAVPGAWRLVRDRSRGA